MITRLLKRLLFGRPMFGRKPAPVLKYPLGMPGTDRKLQAERLEREAKAAREAT